MKSDVNITDHLKGGTDMIEIIIIAALCLLLGVGGAIADRLDIKALAEWEQNLPMNRK